MASVPEAFYQILQLEKDVCDLEVIKQNYRKLAKKWHPDKNQSKIAHKEFAAIKKAYDYLIKEVSKNIKKRYAHESLKYQNVSPKKNSKQPCLVCFDCESPIAKSMKYVIHNNHIYHENCFNCSNCESPLKKFKFFNENKYCIDCYDEIFGLKCSACTRKIDDSSNFILYENKYYHRDCVLKCNHCKKTTLANDCCHKFSKNYCFKCYDLLFAPKCFSCGYFSNSLLLNRDGIEVCLRCLKKNYYQNMKAPTIKREFKKVNFNDEPDYMNLHEQQSTCYYNFGNKMFYRF